MKKKILLIIPKLGNGGIERIASNLSKNLSDEYEQTIYSIMDYKESYDFKVSPIILKEDLGKNSFQKFIVFKKRLIFLNKLLKSEKFDAIISFGDRCNLLNILSKKNGKKILTIHSKILIENKSKKLYGKIYKFFIEYFYEKLCWKIVAVSNSVKEDLVKIGINPKNIEIIYNGYEIKKIQNLSCEQIKDDKYIVAVGRITYAKGYIYLINALKYAKNKIPNIKLKIIGEEEEKNIKNFLLQKIEEEGLSKNVEFIGYKSNPYKYIKNAKCLVLTSIFEGFAGVIVESLACGTPIITTDSGGPTEILFENNKIENNKIYRNDYGTLVPALKPGEDNTNVEKAIGSEILYYYSNKKNKEKLIRKAYDFDIKVFAKKFEKLIGEN